MTKVTNAKDLLPLGDLVDVRYVDLSAKTLDEPRGDYEADDVQQDIEVRFGHTERVIEVQVKASVRSRIADYEVTAATQFHVQEGVTFTEEVVAEFAEKVGAMAIYPYLREAVQSLTTRLHEAPITMPLMRQTSLVNRNSERLLAD